MDIGEQIRSAIQRLGSDWVGEQAVRLGNYDEVVITGTPGRYYARQHNGAVIEVVNSSHVPPYFDLHVLVRRSRIQPNVWKIAETLEDYDTPAGAGEIAYHHEQHEEGGGDRLELDRKQIKQLSARVAGTWTVRVFGATIQTSAGIANIANQDLDLSSYVVTTGAKFVSIETDATGTLSINEGAPFGSPETATLADIPTPGPGKYGLAYVLFYEGQASLFEDNIRVFFPLPGGAANLFDDTEGDPEDVSIVAPDPGSSSFAARRDHVHLYEPDPTAGAGSHEHSIARWNGEAAQTVFELPDFASSVEWIALNGLIEDPLVYTLSSDGGTITLDTGLPVDMLVTASYIVLSL